MDSRQCTYSSGSKCCNYMSYGHMYLAKNGQVNPVDTFTTPFPYSVPSLNKLGLMPPTVPSPSTPQKIPCSSVYCKQF